MRQAVVEYKPGEQTRTRLKLVKRGSQFQLMRTVHFTPLELQNYSQGHYSKRSKKGSKHIPPAGHFMLPLAA